ncbi:MAG TPA: hypothetical protein VIV60_04455, partial [Polyangiaceae bacterium]
MMRDDSAASRARLSLEFGLGSGGLGLILLTLLLGLRSTLDQSLTAKPEDSMVRGFFLRRFLLAPLAVALSTWVVACG